MTFLFISKTADIFCVNFIGKNLKIRIFIIDLKKNILRKLKMYRYMYRKFQRETRTVIFINYSFALTN